MSWYKDWFNSPYYHILYKNRDEKEAERFIQNLLQQLSLAPRAKVMDLACGKGRHSKFLAQMGYSVVGLDLASASILEAQKDNPDGVTFAVHDMREVYAENAFDAIFSFFTSFGYFNNRAEDVRVFKSVEKQLKPKGLYVLDFMNANKVKKNLVAQENKTLDGVTFRIERKLANGQIQKTISFDVEGKSHSHTEKVSDLDLPYFESLAVETNLQVKAVYGSYDLTDFDPETSDRLILHFQKK